MPNFQRMKLGKAPVKIDKRTLQLEDYLKPEALPALPESYMFSPDIKNWGMMGNNTIGDCVIAAMGHSIMSWTDDNKNLFVPPDAAIIGAYSAITGYVPGDPSTDNGTVFLDALKYWKNTGIAGHKIDGFIQFNYRNSKQLQYSVYLFGVALIGIQLPVSAQSQTNWSVGPNLLGDNAPGSWGGHGIPVIGWDKEGLYLVTWGQVIKMSWNFYYCYADESYVALSPDFVKNGVSPDGFDLKTLQTDLTLI